MAGAGLVTIKRRIRTITNTKKITKAMGLVATTKLQKARRGLTSNKGFYSECQDITREVFENYGKENIFTSGNISNKKLILVFTSEKGFCGGFNVNIFDKVAELIRGNKANTKIILIGHRGTSYLSRLGTDITADIAYAQDVPEFSYAESTAQRILKMFTEGEVGEVYAVFTHFISGVKQAVEILQLLPLPYKYNDCSKDIVAFEPSIDLLVEETVKLHLNEQILYCMLNSASSEHSARMNAMNSATRNADELLEKLHLKFNRVRQGIITQEISEIVGGAEALR